MALARRRPVPGLVHHSDRGVQYARRDYTPLLHDQGIQTSMSRKANPWDNAACEPFLKTLKYEEVYRTEYRDLALRDRALPHRKLVATLSASLSVGFCRWEKPTVNSSTDELTMATGSLGEPASACPLSVTMKEKIEGLRAWAHQRAVPAN